MADDDYEILPHQLLADLRYDVEALKKKLSEPDSKINELILEIESMKDAVHELTSLFQKVLEEAKEEDPSKLLRSVVSQNETIARGMIAISDKLEDFMSKQSASESTVRPALPPSLPPQPAMNVQHSMGLPQFGMGPERVAPRSFMEPSMQPSQAAPFDFPPPPPSAGNKKRVGVFR